MPGRRTIVFCAACLVALLALGAFLVLQSRFSPTGDAERADTSDWKRSPAARAIHPEKPDPS